MKTRLNRITSMFLAVVMVFTMIPASALAAGINEALVSSLAEVYDGDEGRARAELEALYEAGIIDADGNMVSLDLREDGESAELSEVAQRIANGEEVGELTINGRAVTREKLMQIQQVNSMLEVLRLINKDVEITDEHVANLESLIAGLADGSIDLSDVISRGEVRTSAKRSARLLGTGNSDVLPENTGSGTVDAGKDGKYTAPYISESTYEAGHSFALLDPENKTWYTEGKAQGAEVTITCAEQANAYGTFTVTATLSKTTAVPVSFDWSAVSDVIALKNDPENGAVTSGTVTWEANDTELAKTFKVTFGAKSGSWVGSQCFVINMDNIKNAAFEGGKAALSKTVQVNANDKAAVTKEYPCETKGYGLTYCSQVETFVNGEIQKHQVRHGKINLPSSGRIIVETGGGTFNQIYLVRPNAFSLSTTQNNADDRNNLSNVLKGYIDSVKMGTNATFSEVASDGSNALRVVQNGQAWLIIDCLGGAASVNVTVATIPTHDKVTSVTAPEGTYYSGQVVPVTVTLEEPAIFPADTTLTVNKVECPMLNKANTEAKMFTFGYTVKEIDTGAINVTALNGAIKNAKNEEMQFDDEFPVTTIGRGKGVILTSDVKLGSLDWENVKYGIDDAGPGDQIVTVVIPFKDDVDSKDKNWIASEGKEINPPISLPIPDNEEAAAGAYLRSAYFSADDGATRYPIYVIGDNADALAARFSPAQNTSAYLRKDTLNLYLDTEVGAAKNYLGERQKDAKGFAYFTADSETPEAPAVAGKSVSYYVKGGVAFDKTATVDRPNYAEENIMKDADGKALGFYKEGALYVAVQGEDASKQHDVELMVNEALYKAVSGGVRVEEPNTLMLSYQTSERDPKFTFTKPIFFTWSSSDEEIATVVKNENGSGQLSLNGKGGPVTITLTVGNGSERKQYDLSFTFTVLEGKTPFFKIPAYSRNRVTLAGENTDVPFSSNVTARNAAAGHDTVFTAKLYAGGKAEGEPKWTHDFESTVANTLTHITVPGEQIANTGTYALVISTEYKGGQIDGATTPSAEFSATANLTVKQAPLTVKLNKLNSYSVDYDHLANTEIGYTVAPAAAAATATVQYTIQKSGAAVSARKTATGGVIPIAGEITKPTGLKDAYTITVYAKAADAKTWSVDSMVLRVYNMDALELIVKDVVSGAIGGTTGGTGDSMNGKTVTMDNHGKLAKYDITSEESFRLTVEDLNLLRTDMSLQKLISANYGDGVWGLLSDKMEWNSSNSDLVSINYKQGGIYSDIRNYSYTSYGPATDFLLVGKGDAAGDNKVTIRAKHAGTGKTAEVTVEANTLKDQLYIFQFNPKVETDVTYTNGKNVPRTLKSDGKGVLAVYEPDGIKSAVMAMAKVEKSGTETVTYVGTIFQNELQSGERDIASLQLYPCNNLRLRSISNATLTFRTPDGKAYKGPVTLRAGVYKNGVYCPDAQSFLPSAPETKYGAQDDIKATVSADGKLTIGFDPTQFKNDPGSGEAGASALDKITYVFEYRVDGFQTSYAMLNVSTDVEGEQKPTDSVIQLRTLKGGADVPQITRQTIRQYAGSTPSSYTRDVTDYTENIGLSNQFNMVVLTTDFVLPSSTVTVENGFTTLTGKFALYKVDGAKLTNQTEYENNKADVITKLSDLEKSNLFVFPFSSSPIGRHVYTMTDEGMATDGISDVAAGAVVSSRVKAMFVRDGMALTSVTLPFGVSNLSHQPDISQDADLTSTATGIRNQLNNQMSIGAIFSGINVNDMLQKGFAFLSGLSAGGGDTPLSLMILPTEDPGVFRIVAFVGSKQAKNQGNSEGLKIEYDADTMYEDFSSLMEEDDDDDDGGEGSYDVNFSGTIVLEAGYDINGKAWTIDFRGGSVGLGFSAKYEWSQNFVCGPIPVNVSFEVGADLTIEVSFANKSAAKLMLVDATVGVYIEAFAGLGFDATIAKLKLGIYGRIGADVNFLLLSDLKKTPSNGTQLSINGEIGIRMEVKVLFVDYKKTFASTGFNWRKDYNDYQAIRKKWEDSGSAELFGLTQSGRAYSMRLFANGTALVTIEGGGEIENRDYLELAKRTWNDNALSNVVSSKLLLQSAGGMSNVLKDFTGRYLTSAYPYANPVLTDDGQRLFYISDNNNAEELQSVVRCGVYDNGDYADVGRVQGGNTPLTDSDLVASGGSMPFIAWVKQMESPDKEMKDKTTNDDLGMMMNATEIYAGALDQRWYVNRLTENNVADMSPTVASWGANAIVAWRSLSATGMPEEDGTQDISTMFNAENSINYRIWNNKNETWNGANVAYNGAAGTVNAIDSAMLPDGTAILVYTVRTGVDITTTETFYTVIKNGGVVTTGRLTNDSYTDMNVRVTAVNDGDGYFVLGWYSEHATGETTVDPETRKTKDVVAHDIRLARVNKNGSVDANFPESVGGDAASAITSDFRFSAPNENTELKNVSIVWSQTKDSDRDEDAGKYELNAMRFYEVGGAIGLTSPITIAETGKNVTVDHFDTYTDRMGTVHVVALTSDYKTLEGLTAYDTIDLSDQPVETENGSKLLNILYNTPAASIKQGSAAFPATAVEVSADTDLRELVPGLDLPVQFTVKNTGTSAVDTVTVQLGSERKTVENLGLLPNQSAIINMVYPVPENQVANVNYTVTAGEANQRGTLVLNRPDVGISGMKLLSEANGKRIVQVTLANASGIPLKGSGKTVKLGLYTTPDHEEADLAGEIITISDAAALADIDDGIYGAVQTLDVQKLIGNASEIPDEGIRLYAHAWVENCDELYSGNNDATLAFKGLLTKNNGEIMTLDTSIKKGDVEGAYTVNIEAQNNSLQPQQFGRPMAILQDADGNKLAEQAVPVANNILSFGKEERLSNLSATFTGVKETPARAVVNYSYSVSFNTNGGTGTFEPCFTNEEGRITLPATEPTPPTAEKKQYFDGWYTDATGGEKIADGHVFTGNTTLYAHYVTHQHEWAGFSADGPTITATCGDSDQRHEGENSAAMVINAPALTAYGGAESAEATVTNGIEGVSIPNIVYKQGETVLEAAPTAVGTYTASITLTGVNTGADATGDVTASVEYTIDKATPAAPTGVTVTRTVNTITVTAPAQTEPAKYEYSIDNGENWQDSNEFTGLTPATAYQVVVREKAAENNYAGTPAKLEVTTLPVITMTGTARYGRTLSATSGDYSYQWYRVDKSGESESETEIEDATKSTYTISHAEDIGKTLRVKVTVAGTDAINTGVIPVDSAVVEVGLYTTPVLSVSKTTVTENTIQIDGFENYRADGRYQYSIDGGNTWTSIPGVLNFPLVISGLTPNTTYSIVVQGVEVKSGAPTVIKAGAPSVPLMIKTPAKAVPLTGVSISGTAQVGSTLSAKLNPSDATTVTYQWQISDSEGGTYSNISGATYATYALTQENCNKFIRVMATQSGKDAVTSAPVRVGNAPAVAVANSSIRATATNTSITVTAPRSTATRNYEYSLDNANWQTENVFNFEAAESDTQKTVYVRTGGADWQVTGTETEVGQATVSVPGKPYPFDAAPTVVAKSFEYQGYTNEKAPTLSIELKAGAEKPTFQYRVGASGEWAVWTADAANSLSVGSNYYMRAVINGNDTYHAYTTESATFKVEQNKTVSREAPVTPTVSDNSLIVTIAETDRGKALEYQMDGTADDKWVSVPVLNKDGQFTLGALSAGNHTVNLRYRADSNYQKPSASVASAEFTLSQYSVAYDANGGSNAPAPQTATSPNKIKVYTATDKAHSPTRSGYTFTGWFTAKTAGEEVSGTEVEASATYYAQWTANTYTVAFNANRGTGEMASVENVAYDAELALTLPPNKFTREGYIFAGWATCANGSVVYTDKQNVKNLTTGTGTVTLYAVWGAAGAEIGGTITGAEGGVTEVTLKRGDIQIGETQIAALAYVDGEYTATYTFKSIPDGIYNIVAVQNVERLDQDGNVFTEPLTVTSAISIVNGAIVTGNASFAMPESDYSSIVSVAGTDTPPVVVGGLDTEAASSKLDDRSVTVTMTVEKKEETTADVETKDAIEAIASTANAPTEERDYLNIDVKKEITKNGQSEGEEAVTETAKLIDISIPYDLSGKSNAQISLYRFHDGAATKLGTSSNDTSYYTLDRTNNLIVLHTKLFSTYAIGYNPDAAVPSSGGTSGAGAAQPTVNETANGTVTIAPENTKSGEKVTITAKPDEGYAVDTVSVTDANGKAVSVTKVNDTTYTFTQPSGKVKIDVTFKAVSKTDALARFVDVSASDWYADAVRWALDNGVMQGVSPKYFNPNGDTTRAMVATMLWRLEGSPVVSGEMKFVDVAEGTWYTEAVRWASGAGIITGSKIPAETTPWPMGFLPDDAVTREQLAAMLYRYAQYKKRDVSVGEDTNILSFNDAQNVSGWATDAMQWAVGDGIITGMDGNLVPKGTGTRAQVATMLMRFIKSIVK